MKTILSIDIITSFFHKLHSIYHFLRILFLFCVTNSEAGKTMSWWQYFDRKEKRYAFCKVKSCPKSTQPYDTGTSYSTRSLKSHMEQKHPELIVKSIAPKRTLDSHVVATSKVVSDSRTGLLTPTQTCSRAETTTEPPAKKQKTDETPTVIELLSPLPFSYVC